MEDKCPFCKIPCNMEHCPYTKTECTGCEKIINGYEKQIRYLLDTIHDLEDTNRRIEKLRKKYD